MESKYQVTASEQRLMIEKYIQRYALQHNVSYDDAKKAIVQKAIKQYEELKKFLKQIEKTDLLICDEWGYIPFEKDGSQLLFQVISECYEKRSLIITTNLEFSKWNSIFYDEKLTSAIIDRIIHHSHLLMFNGSSYRLKHSSINC